MNLCLEKRKGIFLIFVRSGQAILQLRKIRSILPEQEILCWRTSTTKQPYQKTYITIERDEQRRELVPFICAWGKKQRFTRTYICIYIYVHIYTRTRVWIRRNRERKVARTIRINCNGFVDVNSGRLDVWRIK